MRTKEQQEQYIDRLKKRLSKDYEVVIEPYIKCDGEYNWFFNWEGSHGYNTIWAKSKKDAIRKVKQKFGMRHKINVPTLRRQTSQGRRDTDRMGYMMTC
jgi:hypothetical protein